MQDLYIAFLFEYLTTNDKLNAPIVRVNEGDEYIVIEKYDTGEIDFVHVIEGSRSVKYYVITELNELTPPWSVLYVYSDAYGSPYRFTDSAPGKRRFRDVVPPFKGKFRDTDPLVLYKDQDINEFQHGYTESKR